MKRRILFMFVTLTAVWLQGRAQIRYEQWIDGNRNSIQYGSLILGEQTITVDVSGMPYPGLHFLNILPYDDSGKPGIWKSIAFYMPEGWPESTQASELEYWVTGYDRQVHREPYSGTAVTLDIDASQFSPGLHFLNLRTLNSVGEAGPWKVVSFLMPEGWPNTTDAEQIEYWVTGYDREIHRLPYSGTAVTLDIDASQFSPGMHFLNLRTLNSTGEAGPWKVITFLMPEGWPGTTQASELEYWVTGYDKEPKRMTFTGGALALDIDVSEMSYGLHFLNVRTFSDIGEPGPWKQIAFYLSNGIFDPEDMGYEYWIDQQTDTVKATGSFPGLLTLDIDVSEMAVGTHTFNFRAKNSYGEYGETFTIQFEKEPDPITIKANSYEREYGEDNPIFEYTVEGPELIGVPNIQCDATKSSPVGTYDIVISKGSVTNKNDTYVDGTLKIVEAPLTIAANSWSIKKGDTLPVFDATYIGFKNDETESVLTALPVFSCSATSDSVPGTYTITVSGADAENYNISYVAGILTITEPPAYTVRYMVDGEEYKSCSVIYGDTIIPEPEPSREGYTFSGWTEIPSRMPPNDIEVIGSFTVNKYLLSVMVSDTVFYSDSIAYGTRLADYIEIIASYGIDLTQWEYFESADTITMPDHDVTINAVFDSVISIIMDNDESAIYDLNGRMIETDAISKLPPGIYMWKGYKIVIPPY